MHSGERMEWWRNKIPFGAVIFETIVALTLILLTIFLFSKYFERKKKPNLYLGLTFLSFTLASLTTAIGRWVGFFSPVSYEILSITDLTSLISYIFIAISNCFAVFFLDSIFFQKSWDFTFIFFLLNGVVIGLLLPEIYYWIFVSQDFGLIREQTFVLAALSILSLVSYGLVSIFAFKEAKHNTDSLPKIGFNLIGVYGICIPLLFVFFTGDTILISNVESFSRGYTPFYYLGWCFAVIGVILGYLGYIMPKWFKNIHSPVKES